MKNLLFVTVILAIASLQANADCPQKLNYNQLLALFHGQNINVDGDVLQKESALLDDEIKANIDSTNFFPAKRIVADRVNDDGMICTYNYHGATWCGMGGGCEAPFKVKRVVAKPERTKEQAERALGLTTAINPNVVKLKYKNFIKQFYLDPANKNDNEKIRIFNEKQNDWALLTTGYGFPLPLDTWYNEAISEMEKQQ